MLTFRIGLSATEHDDFLKQHEQANLLQSSRWAIIKDSWGNDRFGFYRDGVLIAVASVLLQPLPLGFTLLYIPRGPVMDYQDEELVRFVFKVLKHYGKEKRALFIKCDPSLLLSYYKSGENEVADKTTLPAIDNLTKVGAVWTGRTTDLSETIQPRFQAKLYAKEFSPETLPKKIKQTLRTTQNKGVTTVIGHLDLLDDFTALMSKTEQRKHISLRNKTYYRKLLETYGTDAYITMAQLDIRKRQSEVEKALEKASSELITYTSDTRHTKVQQTEKEIERLSSDLAFFKTYLDKGLEIVPLAATLSINFANTSENIYAGMDEEFRSYNPALLVWLETAKQAFQMGATWQNLGGVENDLSGGLYRFKSKFNPTIEEFVGEFNIPVNRILYRIANFAYKTRKRLRRKH